MMRKVSVEELCASPGFDEMMEEYLKLSIKSMPTPIRSKEDYLQLEKANVLTIWCAVDAGKVIGFISCLLSKIPHYGVPIAVAESFYVREPWRNHGVGVRLIKMIERFASTENACAVFFSSPVGSNFGDILEKMHYKAETVTHVKVL